MKLLFYVISCCTGYGAVDVHTYNKL